MYTYEAFRDWYYGQGSSHKHLDNSSTPNCKQGQEDVEDSHFSHQLEAEDIHLLTVVFSMIHYIDNSKLNI